MLIKKKEQRLYLYQRNIILFYIQKSNHIQNINLLQQILYYYYYYLADIVTIVFVKHTINDLAIDTLLTPNNPNNLTIHNYYTSNIKH